MQTINAAFLVGRIIFGVYWLMAAYAHIFQSGGMVGYAASKGVPAPKLAIIGTGILILLGGLSILFGVYVKIGIILLIIFLIGITFQMHDFWKETDMMERMNSRINFTKNLALVGALLMMLAIPAPWAYSLGM
jgi:putative oxidoreductase